MSVLQIETPEVYAPLLEPGRYKGAHGGRGSGKSHFFGELLVETALLKPGFRGLCVREVQKSLKDSAKKLVEDKIAALKLGRYFNVLSDRIETPGGGLFAFVGMQDHTSESVKSLEGFDAAWVEEAQALSQRSLTLLRPTIRKPGSELWFSWNPTRKKDAVDQLLRGKTLPPGSIVVQANWRDNPWFPAELDVERRFDKANRPDHYDHVWEGGYAKVFEGAYFAAQLTEARRQKRIGIVPRDPLMALRAYWDIGGTGAKADACAIWIVQFVGREIRVLAYYEARGQELGEHIGWLRASGYEKALMVLPHDGATNDKVYRVSYESALKDAGFKVRVVRNQGAGAANQRIEAVRRWFPRIWINEPDCEAGLEALAAYHERRDDKREVGLGPDHDWASHGADAFGLMASDYTEPTSTGSSGGKLNLPNFATA